MDITCATVSGGICTQWAIQSAGDPTLILTMGFGAGLVAGAVGFGVGAVVRMIRMIRL